MNTQRRSNNNAAAYLREYRRIFERMKRGMSCAELKDSVSYNFIVQMIPHHRAAIEMSENLLKYTGCGELSEIARNIITEQTQSINDMLAIKEECLLCESPTAALREYQSKTNEITALMFREMCGAYSDRNISCDFMREMIPHHMGAVRMSENALNFCICHKLEPILKAIISSQEKGICEMKALMKRQGCAK